MIAAWKRAYSIKPNIIDLKNYKEAQNSPCPFGTFCIIFNGKVIANHPISKTRFIWLIEIDPVCKNSQTWFVEIKWKNRATGIQDGIVIEAGYHSLNFYEGIDPRNNSEIFDFFQKVGKLIQ